MFYASSLTSVQCSAIFFTLLISIIRASFLAKANEGRLAKEELYSSKEDSVLQCIQRCMFISKDAIMNFDELKMTCLCFSSVDKAALKANDETDTKVSMYKKREITQIKNHALKKPSKQSTTAPVYSLPNDAKYANDGDTSTRSATNNHNKNEWFELDMEEVVKIGLIKLMVNEWAVEKGYYKNLTILTRVYDADAWKECETFANPTQLILESSCQPLVSARFVRIRNSFNNPLYLEEVEVYDQGILKIRNL